MDKKILTDSVTKPEDLLKKLLQDNNLVLNLIKQPVRYMEDGGLVIEPPKIIVSYVQPKSETLKN